MSASAQAAWLSCNAGWCWCFLALLPAGLAGCAAGGKVPVFGEAGKDEIATDAGPLVFARLSDYRADSYKLVFVEGDGFAYLTREQPSADPTPRNAVALEMARAATAQHEVVYLARPGQWGTAPSYTPADWTTRRFSSALVSAQARAVEEVGGDDPFVLVGYSGGAAIARVAARYTGALAGVITVAGNLYPNTTNAYNKVPPFTDLHDELGNGEPFEANLPVLVVRGSDDRIIPPPSEPDTACRQTLVVPATHAGLNNGQPWASLWPQIYAAWQSLQMRCAGVAQR